MEEFGGILLLLYLAAGYWAVGKTIWADKIIIGTGMAIFSKRLCLGFALGWALIPWAFLKGK